MKSSRCLPVRSVGALCLAYCQLASQSAEQNLTASLQGWAVEQAPGGTTIVKDGALVISDAGGCTVWYREKLSSKIS